METHPKEFFQDIARNTETHTKYFGTIHNFKVRVHKEDNDSFWPYTPNTVHACVTVNNLITISKFTANFCSINIIESLIAHEVGHIKLGHIDLLMEHIRVTNTSVSGRIDWELEADMYAAVMIVDAQCMSNALSLTFTNEICKGTYFMYPYMIDLSHRINTLNELVA